VINVLDLGENLKMKKIFLYCENIEPIEEKYLRYADFIKGNEYFVYIFK
jgi:hypothetical protein